MTVRPPRPCIEPGCPELVRGQNPRCPVCARKHRAPKDRQAVLRDPERYVYYRSQRWKDLRAWKLEKDPLCERCLVRNRIVKADEVHHLDGDFRNENPANLQSICNPCHTSESGRESQRRRRAKRAES